MPRIQIRIVILAGVLTAVLLGMVGIKQYTLSTGSVVELEIKPIDPRSLFRGDFVRFRFTISELSTGEYFGDFRRGDTIYVVLEPGTPFATPVSTHKDWPKVANDQLVIKGRVTGRPHNIVRIRYGIENFFIPEGEGRSLERSGPENKVTVRVAIDRFGRSAIESVLVNGEPRHSETLF